eukprot:15366460-Ditylum_brightwellii.AAC.4
MERKIQRVSNSSLVDVYQWKRDSVFLVVLSPDVKIQVSSVCIIVGKYVEGKELLSVMINNFSRRYDSDRKDMCIPTWDGTGTKTASKDIVLVYGCVRNISWAGSGPGSILEGCVGA